MFSPVSSATASEKSKTLPFHDMKGANDLEGQS